MNAGGQAATEGAMVGWHHRLNGQEFEQALGDSEGQGSLGCWSPRDCKESDTIECCSVRTTTIGKKLRFLKTAVFQYIYPNRTFQVGGKYDITVIGTVPSVCLPHRLRNDCRPAKILGKLNRFPSLAKFSLTCYPKILDFKVI